jgi:hypothetical protein
MIGQKFGRLTVMSRAPATAGNRGARWNCECECGNTTISRSDAIKNGRASSCGCLGREASGKRIAAINTTHGMAGSPIYRIWASMLNRCKNENEPCFPNYGGRGISVASDWEVFENFYADMGDRPEGMTLERIDVDGDYSKDNCVWADRKQQANNKRNNHVIVHKGESKTLSQWAEYYAIPMWKLHQRLVRDGLSFSEAIINDDRRFKGASA